jgi:hypothetical protein
LPPSLVPLEHELYSVEQLRLEMRRDTTVIAHPRPELMVYLRQQRRCGNFS